MADDAAGRAGAALARRAAAPRARDARRAHALLLHGPAGVGQFELGLLLAQGWLCESTTRAARPSGPAAPARAAGWSRRIRIPTCCVLVPEALREGLGWAAADAEERRRGQGRQEEAEQGDPRRGGARRDRAGADDLVARPRQGDRASTRPSAMNADRRQRVAEDARGAAPAMPASCSAPPRPTRCCRRSAAAARRSPLALPPDRGRGAWLAAQGVAEPEVLLAGCGGQPQDVLALAQLGVDAAAWRRLPGPGGARATSRRCAAGRCRWRSMRCRSSATTPPVPAAGAAPRYFAAATLPRRAADLARAAALGARAASRRRVTPSIPGTPSSSLESLVEQGREALQTPRSAPRRGEVDSLHLRR